MSIDSFAELSTTLKPADQPKCQIRHCEADATHAIAGIDGVGVPYRLRLCAACHLFILFGVLKDASREEIAAIVDANRIENRGYPCDLRFDAAADGTVAVLQAASDLELPTAIEGPLVRVTMRSPQEAFRFGERTRDLLQGAPVPDPVPPSATP